jgi:hypothetical protein
MLFMNKKDHAANKATDGVTSTRHKGESTVSRQKSAPGVSKKDAGKHTKDESHGAKQNTTKKQGNSI